MASRYRDRKTKKGRYTKHFRQWNNPSIKYSSSGGDGIRLPSREQVDQMRDGLDQMNEQMEQQYNYERSEFGVVITKRDENLDTAIVISASDMIERERRVVENNGVTENGGIDEDGAMQQAIEMSQDVESPCAESDESFSVCNLTPLCDKVYSYLAKETSPTTTKSIKSSELVLPSLGVSLFTSSSSSSPLIVEVPDRSATTSSPLIVEVPDLSAATSRNEEESPFYIEVFARHLKTNKPVLVSVCSDTFDGLLEAIYEKMGIDNMKSDPWLSVGKIPLMPDKSLTEQGVKTDSTITIWLHGVRGGDPYSNQSTYSNSDGYNDDLSVNMDITDSNDTSNTLQSQRMVTTGRGGSRRLFQSGDRSLSLYGSRSTSPLVGNVNGHQSIQRVRQPLSTLCANNNVQNQSRNVFDKRQLIQSQLSISQQQFNQHQREILNGFLSGNGEPNYQEAMASCLVKKRELEQAAQITTGQDNLRLVDTEVTVQGVHQDIVLHHQERVSSLEQRLRQVSIGQHQVTNLNSEKQRLTRLLQQERESSRQAVERQREDNARQLQFVEMQRDENARQLQTLNQSLSSKSDQVNRVNRQLVEKSAQLRTIQSSLTAATNSVSAKCGEISQLKSTNQALNRQVEEKSEQLVSTEQALSNVTQEKIDTERSLSEAQSWSTTAESTIKSLRSDLSRVTKEKIDAESSLSEAQSSCQAAKDLLTTATRLKDEAELSLSEVQSSLVAANQEKDAAERLLSRVTKEKDAAESSLSEVQSSLDTTKSTIESLRTGLSRANQEKDAAEKLLSRVIKEKDAVVKSLSDAQLSFANQLSSSTSETTSQMSHLESERDALELHNKELEDQVNELKEKIQEYKDEIESNVDYLSDAKDRLDCLERARTSLKGQLSESTDTIEVLQSEVSKSKQLRRNLELEMEKMSKIANDRGRDAQIELNKQLAKVSQLAKSLETAQGLVDNYRSDINDLQEKITGLDDQIMDLKCNVDSQDDDMGQHTNDDGE